MKKLFALFSLITVLALTSCGGGGNASEDAALSPKERDAVRHVRKHIGKGEKLLSYEIAEGPMPVELMTDEYKRYRDDVFKAGLDYVNCLKRGLEEPAMKQAQKIQRIQEEIIVKTHEWREEQGTSTYLFVLANVLDPKSSEHPQYKLIAVFNPVTMQNDFWLPLTTPFVNNAAMILNAENGTLFEYATNPDHDTAALAQNVENPVLNFIFSADPSTVR